LLVNQFDRKYLSIVLDEWMMNDEFFPLINKDSILKKFFNLMILDLYGVFL